MTAHRINERNTGDWTMSSDRKQRPAKGVTIRGQHKDVTAAVLQKVYDAMQKEEIGFTDGGRFTLLLDREEMTILSEVINKMNDANA